MEIYTGIKLKMTQLFRDDRAIAVTPVRLSTRENAASFSVGEFLQVSGISKGKGFQGVVKRHGFHGGPKTHGQKNRLRAPGSIGNTTPQRVIPGRRMAGHMGAVRVSVRNLTLIELIPEQGILMIAGAVPGNVGGAIKIRKAKQ